VRKLNTIGETGKNAQPGKVRDALRSTFALIVNVDYLNPLLCSYIVYTAFRQELACAYEKVETIHEANSEFSLLYY